MSIENRKSFQVRDGKKTYFINIEINRYSGTPYIAFCSSLKKDDTYDRREIIIDKSKLQEVIDALVAAKEYMNVEVGKPNYMQQQKEKWTNAYHPWTDEQNSQLADLYYSGEDMEEICDIMQRGLGAIRSQIRKLNL